MLILKSQKEQERKIELFGTITAAKAEEIDNQIKIWNKEDEEIPVSKRKNINIYFNTSGTDVIQTAQLIIDSMTLSRTPINCINIGVVKQNCFYIYLYGDRRISYPNAIFIYQKPIEWENNDKEAEVTFYGKDLYYKNQEEHFKKMLLTKTKVTDNQYEKHSKNSWFMSAEAAKKMYFCLEILSTY